MYGAALTNIVVRVRDDRSNTGHVTDIPEMFTGVTETRGCKGLRRNNTSRNKGDGKSERRTTGKYQSLNESINLVASPATHGGEEYGRSLV